MVRNQNVGGLDVPKTIPNECSRSKMRAVSRANPILRWYGKKDFDLRMNPEKHLAQQLATITLNNSYNAVNRDDGYHRRL